MRQVKHIKSIQTQLENLNDLKIQLERLVNYVNEVIKTGQSWMDDPGNKQPHYEINSYLAKETEECFQKCLGLADAEPATRSSSTDSNVHNDPTKVNFLFPNSTHEEMVQECSERQSFISCDVQETLTPTSFAASCFKDSQGSEVTNSNSKPVDKMTIIKSKRIRDLEKKLKDNEKKIETLMKEIEAKEHRDEERFRDIVKNLPAAQSVQTSLTEINAREMRHDERIREMFQELRSARNLLSNLESQQEFLFSQGNDHHDKFNDMLRKFKQYDDKASEMMKKIESMNEASQTNINGRNIISSSPTKDTNGEIVQVLKRFDEMEKRISYIDTYIVSVKKEKSSDMTQCKESTELVVNERKGILQAPMVDIRNQIADFTCMVECLQNDCLLLRQETVQRKLAFSVGLSNSQKICNGSIVKYDQIYSNVGECYNKETGIFTSNIDGLYIFHVDILSDKKEGASLYLIHNSEDNGSVYVSNENLNSSWGKSIILHLNKNDVVYLKARQDSTLFGLPQEITNTFCGFLIYADY